MARKKPLETKPETDSSSSSQLSSPSPLILNNYSHRLGLANPAIETKDSLVLEPTPAQRERLIFMVDDALDTIDTINKSGPPKVRLAAAIDILNRAGLSNKTGASGGDADGGRLSPAFIRDSLLGIAAMFGKAITEEQAKAITIDNIQQQNEKAVSKERDVTPPGSFIPQALLDRMKEN